MDQGRLLALALELAAEGVTGRVAVRALVGAGGGRPDLMAVARRDCRLLAEGGYPHAARALTLLAMTVHPSAAVDVADAAPCLSRTGRGTCRSAGPGTLRRT